jgi:hypothetical protein
MEVGKATRADISSRSSDGGRLQIMWNLSREAVKMQLLAFRCHGITLITLPPADERDWDIQFLQRSRTLEQWSDGVWGRGR